MGKTFNRSRSKKDHSGNPPPWADSTKNAFTPPTLINPIEPGTAYDKYYPGRGTGIPMITGFFTRMIGDGTQDLLIANTLNYGGIGNGLTDGSIDPRTGRIQLTDWKNIRIVGGDISVTSGISGLLLQATKSSCSSITIEGVRGDLSLAPETDAIGVLGNTSGNRPDVYIMNCHFRGVFGTNMQHDSGRSMPNINVTNGVMICVVDSLTIPTQINVNDKVIVSVGDSSNPLSSNWKVASINSGTKTLVLQNDHGVPWPTDGSTGSGMLWRLDPTAVGYHADTLQIYSSGRIGNVYLDRLHGRGNYQPGCILGEMQVTGMSSIYAEISRCYFEHQDHDPQDFGSISLFLGDHDGTSGDTVSTSVGKRMANAKLYDVYVTGRTLRTLGQIVSPQSSTFVNGIKYGAIIEIINGRQQCWFQKHPHAKIVGVVKFGIPPVDPCAWESVGINYISPGYYDRPSSPSSIPPITTTGSMTVAEDAPRGSEFGIIAIPDVEKGWIIDVYLLDDAGAKVQITGNRLTRGRVAAAAGSYSCTVRAVVRENTSIYRDQIINFTIGIQEYGEIYNTMTNIRAKNLVRALYSTPSLSTIAAIDTLFTTLEVANSGSLINKIKYLGFSAGITDQRDGGVNWVNPGAIDLHANNVPRSFDTTYGFTGSSTNQFTMWDPGFTLSTMGITQNSASIVVGYTMRNPDLTTPGTLTIGTDYIIGNDGLFLAVTNTGALNVRCHNSGSKTTTTTPMVGKGGRMQVIGMTRQSTTGFDLVCSDVGTPFGPALSVNGTSTQSSVSSMISNYNLPVFGRNSAGTISYCTRQIPFFLLGTDLTLTEIETIRGAIYTYFNTVAPLALG